MPDLVQRRKENARSAQAAPTPRSGAPRSTHAAPTPRSVRPSTVLPMSGSTPRTTPRAAWAPPCSTTTTRATRHEADPAKVKKVIEAHHRTPAELRIPFCNLDTATLELVVLPSDLVAATEVVASAVERAAARKVTVIGDVRKHNGPVSVFFRKKCNVREKTVLHALQHNDTYISMAAAKLAGVLNKALCKEALVKLELVGLQHLTEHALTLLAEGLRTNTSLSALCLNDSAIGDTGLLRIIPSLRDHKGLRRLQLCRTQMSDVAGRELMEMLGVQVLLCACVSMGGSECVPWFHVSSSVSAPLRAALRHALTPSLWRAGRAAEPERVEALPAHECAQGKGRHWSERAGHLLQPPWR